MPKLNVEIKGFKEFLLISLYPYKDYYNNLYKISYFCL